MKAPKLASLARAQISRPKNEDKPSFFVRFDLTSSTWMSRKEKVADLVSKETRSSISSGNKQDGAPRRKKRVMWTLIRKVLMGRVIFATHAHE